MGNRDDGKTKFQESAGEHSKIKAYGEDGLEPFGNADAKKLASAYKEISKDGLTAEEKQKLKKLDVELKGAEYKCMGSVATLVVQEENGVQTDFVVLQHDLKQNAGFINPQPISGKPGRKL